MRGWRFPILFATALFFLFVWFLLSQPENSDQASPDAEPATVNLEPLKQVRDVTPDEILKAPELETELVERLPAVEPPPLPEKPPAPNRFERPRVISAGILEVGDTIIQLADIHPVGIDEQCETAAGTYWPCGKFARTEMRQFIRGRPIECDRREVSTQPVRTRCRLASFDISAWLVLTGWAEPAGDLFADELSEAKAGERGIWRKAAP